MVFTVTIMALHGVAITAFWVALPAETTTAGMGTAALTFTLEVGKHVILGPEESPVLAFLAFALALPLKATEGAPELPYRFPGEPTPHTFTITVLHVDGGGCFSLRHVGHVWDGKVLHTFVRALYRPFLIPLYITWTLFASCPHTSLHNWQDLFVSTSYLTT